MSDHIKQGIENVVRIVSPTYNASVESYLRTYLEKNRPKTEQMIGRSALYFSMFEEELQAAEIPVDLKYLAVVESALTPQAISRVGATGLWQFMRPTAREFGLQITKYVDERCDPLLSTKAAITYLSNLFNQFDSWELAMAAYNAGPGRVRYAIRKSGSRDYWKLQGYLPKETRAYVPGFIAASYVMNFYHDHGLIPALPGADLTQTATVPVFRDIAFTQIMKITGVPYEVIRFLNPKYIKDLIPQSEGGHTLVLPEAAAVTMQDFLNSGGDIGIIEFNEFEGIETGVEMEYANRLVEKSYIVKAGDNLYDLARKNDCTVSELQKWNKLSGSLLRIGQRLKIMKMERVLVKTTPSVPTPSLPTRSKIELPSLQRPETGQALPHLARIGATQLPAPVLKSKPDLSGSARILRRRLSAREMGVQSGGIHTALVPGTRLE
jgi:membrane-bound lytic murein transglycosylase D